MILNVSKSKQRVFLSIFFFMSGFTFSSWASRIPTIKHTFDLNEAELGSLLFALPIGSLIGLPISGWLVSRFNSRGPLVVSYALNSLMLLCIGFTTSIYSLVAAVVVFAFTLRIFNISINTQAINLQTHFTGKIVGSFHGFWSTGGIAGILFSTALLAMNVEVHTHFALVAVLTFVVAVYSYQFLLTDDKTARGNKLKLGKPDPIIVMLGVLAFLSSICEGGMFDWSGIYFQKVLNVKIFTYGYLIFMTFMALSRFLSDFIIQRIGMPKTYILSATLIVIGILLAVLAPYFWTALIGFSIVGFGTAAIIPMSFSMAGASKKYSAGLAISVITTYSITGMLIGPPLIGYLAQTFELRAAFITFAICGLMIIPVSQMLFRYKNRMTNK
ncbi:MFS transporter [Arcticibacter svalbardensis]|uniref:MFS transporter n=1 Tax=Arcticibacter svalbardensis TaxID=1288027 RepID=UPI00058EE3CF|nr:MFS transporter [Arcticibacter svalbardensis]